MNPDPDENVTAAAPASREADTVLSWREWLQEYGPRVLLFARQQSRSPQDAEDIFQEALVRLVEKLNANDFTGGQEAWLPYLFTSVRRLAIDHGRRNDRRKRREETVSVETEQEQRDEFHPWFDGEAADEETRELLEEGLKELPPKFAEVIVMKIWGEKTFAEIGEELEISQNTAASRYRYGLEALKRKLSGSRRKGDL